MNETIQNECVIIGGTSNKNGPGRLNDITEDTKSLKLWPGTIDMTGKRYGRLLFIDPMPKIKGKKVKWRCLCDCGKYKFVRPADVRNNHVTSCGCLQKERTMNSNRGRPYEWILTRIKDACISKQKRGCCIENNITYSDILDFVKIKYCHYCNDVIKWNPYTSQHSRHLSCAYYLDRKDNTVGYTKENCIVCCSNCNTFKGSRFSFEEMIELGKTLQMLREARKCKDQPWITHYSRLKP